MPTRRQVILAGLPILTGASSWSLLRYFPGFFNFSCGEPFNLMAGHWKNDRGFVIIKKYIHSQTIEHRIPVEYEPHSLECFPHDSSRILVYPKDKEKAFIVSLALKRVEATFYTKYFRIFSGHGLFIKNGESFLSTESNPELDRGYIVERSSRDLKVIQEIPFGSDPHEMKCMPDKDTIAVADGGKSSCLGFISLRSGKALRHIDVENKSQKARHLWADPSGKKIHIATYAFGDKKSAKLSAEISVFQEDFLENKLKPLKYGAEFQNTYQYLSIVGSVKSGLLVATAPSIDRVRFFDLHSGDFLYEYRVPKAAGVAFDPTHSSVFVNGGEGQLYSFNASDIKQPPIVEQTLMTGSHLSVG